MGKSFREGYLSKRLYDDYRNQPIGKEICFIYNTFKNYNNRKWFVIKDSYLTPINLDTGIIGFPMLVDQDFSVDRNIAITGPSNGIQIRNCQRLLIVKSNEEYQRDQWFYSLLEIKTKSLFAQEHLFKSFAPKRKQQYAQWFVFLHIEINIKFYSFKVNQWSIVYGNISKSDISSTRRNLH